MGTEVATWLLHALLPSWPSTAVGCPAVSCSRDKVPCSDLLRFNRTLAMVCAEWGHESRFTTCIYMKLRIRKDVLYWQVCLCDTTATHLSVGYWYTLCSQDSEGLRGCAPASALLTCRYHGLRQDGSLLPKQGSCTCASLVTLLRLSQPRSLKGTSSVSSAHVALAGEAHSSLTQSS